MWFWYHERVPFGKRAGVEERDGCCRFKENALAGQVAEWTQAGGRSAFWILAFRPSADSLKLEADAYQ